jgi:hypothetical protein
LLTYFSILFLMLSLSNVYVVWLLMELIFLFFILYILNNELKSVGLIIYFFFQSVLSLLLLIAVFFFIDKVIFLLLVAKLGLFPFFYWMVVVSLKVGLLGNVFVLRLQKISVFWILWLLCNISFSFIYILVYLSVFFVVVNLLLVCDFWLLLVYSSIGNTGILLARVYGIYYMYVVLLYLFVVIFIIYLVKVSDSYMELVLVIFFFIVIPPFLLFFIKLYVIISLESVLKVAFLLVVFDVFVLLYYFSIIFMKFILLDLGVLIYMINLLLILLMLVFRSCVAMIVFY